jgi:hypothetical protein
MLNSEVITFEIWSNFEKKSHIHEMRKK